MREFTKENYPMSDRALLDQFVFRNPDAYLTYKQNSCVDRTLQKTNFKEQRKHTRVIKQEELLKSLESMDADFTGKDGRTSEFSESIDTSRLSKRMSS